jgi:hypothetical protein
VDKSENPPQFYCVFNVRKRLCKTGHASPLSACIPYPPGIPGKPIAADLTRLFFFNIKKYFQKKLNNYKNSYRFALQLKI